MKKRIVMLMICGLVIGSVSGCGRSRLDATAVSETSTETEVSEATAAPAESYDDAVFISKTSYTAETDTAADTENDFKHLV